MSTQTTLRHLPTNAEADAEVFYEVSLEDFMETQSAWRPILRAAARTLRERGEPLPHYKHWDWTRKASALGRLDVTFFGVKCMGHLQGLLKADTGTLNRCRIPEQLGHELVYVDYVETAPWNIPEYMEALGRQALFSRVGARLLQAAVLLSIESELQGRIGLHSLPDAEDFYRHIGMSPTETDENKEDLLWFEFTPGAAKEFLRRYQ